MSSHSIKLAWRSSVFDPLAAHVFVRHNTNELLQRVHALSYLESASITPRLHRNHDVFVRQIKKGSGSVEASHVRPVSPPFPATAKSSSFLQHLILSARLQALRATIRPSPSDRLEPHLPFVGLASPH